MAKQELGLKRICGNCGTKFRHLPRSRTCPKCGTPMYDRGVSACFCPRRARGGCSRRRAALVVPAGAEVISPKRRMPRPPEEEGTGDAEAEGDERWRSQAPKKTIPSSRRRKRNRATSPTSSARSSRKTRNPKSTELLGPVLEPIGSNTPICRGAFVASPHSHSHRRHAWGCSSVGRALEWHSRGRRFDSAWLHQLPRAEPFEQPDFSRLAASFFNNHMIRRPKT